MKKLLIVTAEPKNFVPVELQKAAQELNIQAEILDIKKCVLIEGSKGTNEAAQSVSGVFVCNDQGCLDPVVVDSETVVIPRLNEHHLEVKLGMLKRMQLLGAKLVNSPESMELCNDKLMSQVLLNSIGIKTPWSFVVQDLDDIDKVVCALEKTGELKFPAIIKTLRGTHGIGVMKLDSRSSLVSVAQTLAKEQQDFLIQEFFEHTQSARIIMKGSELLAANLRGQPKEKDEFRTNSHLGSETEPYTPNEDEMTMCRRIVELFGSNFCAIDYLVREDQGARELVVLEVNGSPGLENIQKNWPDKKLASEVVMYAMNHSVDTAVTAAEVTTGENPTDVGPPEDLPADNIQEVEPCLIHRLMDEPIEARVDTGAKLSSLHVDSLDLGDEYVKFRRGDVTYKVPFSRTVKIKNVHGGDSTIRPVVKLDLTIKGQRINQAEFTLNDRTHMKYQILIGRNILEPLGLPVLVGTDGGVDRPESEAFDVEEE